MIAESERKRVLFFLEGERYLFESSPVMNKLASCDDAEVIFLSAGEPFRLVPAPDPDKVDELSDRIKVVPAPKYPRPGAKIVAAVEKAVYRLLPRRAQAEWVLNSLPLVLLMAVVEVVDLVFARRTAARLIRELRPDAYVLVRDRNLGLSTALTKLMTLLRRPVVMIPWGYPNTAFLVATRLNSPRNRLDGPQISTVQRWAARHDRGQVLDFDGVRYSYYKPARYLAAKLAGICPGMPWVFGADCDVCMVDSGETKRFLAGHGVPERLLRVTGNQLHDALFRTPEERRRVRDGLKGKYGLGDARIMIIAVPHLPEHGLLDWETHRREMGYVVETCAARTGARILLSIHPRSNPDNYRFLVSKHGAVMLDEPLKAVLAGADYFACQWSGTTTWGPLLGIPTVVLDWFNVPALGFEHLFEVVRRVVRREDLPAVLDGLDDRRDAAGADQLPPFDGRSTERVVNIIRDYVRLPC